MAFDANGIESIRQQSKPRVTARCASVKRSACCRSTATKTPKTHYLFDGVLKPVDLLWQTVR